MKDDLAFVHTSAVHIATFAKLSAEIAPHLKIKHVVVDSLLQDARTHGITDALRSSVQKTMIEAAAAGASVVVCTCSTIGWLAETIDTENKFQAMRIDRAMADLAVKIGRRILVVAALESTIKPTRDLLENSAQSAGVEITIVELLVQQAWFHFENGDQDRYLNAVVSAIKIGINDVDVVVLAQASMAAAVLRIAEAEVPILSSPRIGVEAAIKAIRVDRNH
jgi:hypothetical protein